MNLDLGRLSTLLDGPSPAVLTTYRTDGTAIASPVWFGRVDDTLDVVIADDDVKLRQLARQPACALLVFETTSPFRAVRVEGTATLERSGVTETRRAIARRYLGTEMGDRFTASRGPGVRLRLPLAAARTWDLAAIVPT
jgi:PPOX class probable F420-dependent enzyme